MVKEKKKKSTAVILRDELMLPGFSGFIGNQNSDGKVIYSHEFKEWLFHAQAGACGYCGCDLGETWVDNRKAHVEHIVTRALGGSDLPPNLMYACHSCNTTKSDGHFSIMAERLRIRKSPAYGIITYKQIAQLTALGIDLKIPDEQPLHFSKMGWSHVRPAVEVDRQRMAEEFELEMQE